MKKTAIAAILATLVGSAFALDADSPNKAISSSFSTATKTLSVLWVKSDKPTGPDFTKYVVANITQEMYCYEVNESGNKFEFVLHPGQFWVGDITAKDGEIGTKTISVRQVGCEKSVSAKDGLNITDSVAKTIHIRRSEVGSGMDKDREYEQVGGFKLLCSEWSHTRSDGNDGVGVAVDALTSKSCRVFKEKGQPLPFVVIN